MKQIVGSFKDWVGLASCQTNPVICFKFASTLCRSKLKANECWNDNRIKTPIRDSLEVKTTQSSRTREGMNFCDALSRVWKAHILSFSTSYIWHQSASACQQHSMSHFCVDWMFLSAPTNAGLSNWLADRLITNGGHEIKGARKPRCVRVAM